MSVRGLDGWTTQAFYEMAGIDPLISLESRNGSLSVRGGKWPIRDARKIAQEILDTCDEAEGQFANNKELRK